MNWQKLFSLILISLTFTAAAEENPAQTETITAQVGAAVGGQQGLAAGAQAQIEPFYFVGKDREGNAQMRLFRVDLDGSVSLVTDFQEIERVRVESPSIYMVNGIIAGDEIELPTGLKIKPNMLAASLIGVSYKYQKNRANNLTINGAVVEFFKIEGRVAFEVLGATIDLCAGGNLEIYVGSNKAIRGNEMYSSFAAVNAFACAGLSIPDKFKLKNQFSVTHMGAHLNADGSDKYLMTTINNQVRVDDIGGSGFGVYWNHGREHTRSPDIQMNVTTNTFGVTYSR